MNHPERIAFAVGNTVPVLFENNYSIQKIQSIVSTTQQETSVRFSLRMSLQAVVTALYTNHNFTMPTSAVVFISDTTDASNVDGAQTYADRLKQMNIRVTLIAMGDKVTTSALTNYTSNFVNWTDLTKPQPDDWANQFGPAFGCSGGVSTVGTTLPASTTKPLTSAQTTVSGQPGTTTGIR